MPRACWAASTSVGASSAAWPPASTTCAMARSATTVLPGADLALQQPVHRLVAVELGGELLPHLALALGQLEGQRGVDGVEQAPGAARPGDAGFQGGGAPAGGEGELEDQRLVPLEPVRGALDVLDRGGPVDVEQRGGQRRAARAGRGSPRAAGRRPARRSRPRRRAAA